MFTVNVIRQTTSSLGAAANYRGFAWSVAAKCTLKPAGQFASFKAKDAIKSRLQRPDANDFRGFIASNLASGALAGLVTLPFSLTTDMPTTLAQADLRPDAKRHGGAGHALAMLRNSSGLGFTLVRTVPLSALGALLYRGPYFGFFDTLKQLNQ